ncbi:hypothetical protein RB597_007365 [Gaeumannomyces tritici]
MFRTRMLDEHLQNALRNKYYALPWYESRDSGRMFYKQGERDMHRLVLLKRYLAYRILSKPHLSPECPETLLRRAAARLAEELAYHAQGDGPLKEILLHAAIHMGNVNLAKRMYALESWDLCDVEVARRIYALQSTDPESVATAISKIQDGRLVCAASHGGREVLQLFCAKEWNFTLASHPRGEFSDDFLMVHIVKALEYGCDTDLIHYLLDAGEWDLSRLSAWATDAFRGAMLRASSPDILERLVRLAVPGFSLLNSTHHFRRQGTLYSWATPMAGRLVYHAAAGNAAMLQYLLDQQGGAAVINNPDSASLPAHPTTPEAARDLEDGRWLKPRVRSGGNSRRYRPGNRPLLAAALAGAADTAALLLDRGADPNAHLVGATPLGEAARCGDAAVARLLLGRGRAGPNLGTPPPVALAAAAEDEAMLALLLEAGAVVDTPETGGWAAALARRDGLESMLDLLEGLGVERGAAWHHVPSLEEFILGQRYFGNRG